jgi:hypothetical protein
VNVQVAPLRVAVAPETSVTASAVAGSLITSVQPLCDARPGFVMATVAW